MAENPKKQAELIGSVRKDYTYATLDEAMLASSPFEQFERWLQDAVKQNIIEPNAMVVATATRDGTPSARALLLKDYSDDGFIFYTTRTSQKGRELNQNPKAALTFFWTSLERQIRIEGTVRELSREDTEKYFRARPREAQLAAYTSPQSDVIADRATLEKIIEENRLRFENSQVPLPDHWAAYCVVPTRFEFWQGRPSRLHDRLQYQLNPNGKGWLISRLAP